ncbi:MAG: asparagine synthase C-terminal domain-containing protein [Deltaproteobacteria bacterium]|nr:asparagine synthase C-terminal domain-containing protein [Deltaproteobacteria bacterium]
MLDLMYIPAPATPFTQIKKLPPGSYLQWRAGALELIPYWTMALPETDIQDEPHLAETFEGLFEDSVRLQMRSDVPVGCFLSGGIDSSAVTALASLQTSLPMTTWHMSGTDMPGKMDESPLAAAVSRRYGTRHFTKNLADEVLITELPKLIWHLEEPIGDGAFVLTYGLAKMAAEQVKVILSGAGGDELFGGYAHYRNLYFWESIIKRLLFGKQVESSYYDRMAPRQASRWPEYFPWHGVSISRKEEFDQPFNANRFKDPLNALMLADLQWYLPDNILFLTDKMTMAASLECRVPLLDHRIVELSLRTDSGLKIRSGQKKYILNQIMKKYLPHEVIYRQKEGFGAPVVYWVNKYRKKYFDQWLLSGYLCREGMINQRKLRTLLAHDHLHGLQAWRYWQILILEIWMQLFVGDWSISLP